MAALTATALLITELFLCLTHLRVLLIAGRPLAREQLYAKTAYFCVDLAAVQVALRRVFPGESTPLGASIVGLTHMVLHVYYLAFWRRRAPHVEQIVAWSTAETTAERIARCGVAGHAWCLVGTAFDVAVHGWMMFECWQLLRLNTSHLAVIYSSC